MPSTLHNPNHEAHLFICTNKKEKGESCGMKDSQVLREQLKKLIDEKYPQWKGKVRLNASGCLGPCAKGIASVCYPQGDWHTELKSTDVEYLENYLLKVMK